MNCGVCGKKHEYPNCPFCGKESKVVHLPRSKKDENGKDTVYLAIYLKCEPCEILVPEDTWVKRSNT